MTDMTASSSDIMEGLDNLTEQLSQVRTRLGTQGLEASVRLQQTSSDKKGRTRGLGSSRSRIQPSLLSPVARMQLNQLQQEADHTQKQRTLARIGQLYLDQQMREQNNEDTSDGDEQGFAPMASEDSSSSQGSGHLNPSQEEFYQGFNPLDDGRSNSAENWVHIHGQPMVSSWAAPGLQPSLRSNNRNDAVTYPVTAFRGESSDDVVNAHLSQDTKTYEPNTVLKKNITKRRSQGRPRDRQSLGKTSRPVESLVA